MRVLVAGLIMLCVCTGCADVAPTNPYDPDTPASQQAVARISGQLILPEGFFGADHFDGQTVALTSASVTDDEPRNAAIDIDGQFEFNEVPAGIYQLLARFSGFEPLSLLVIAERGVTLVLPDVFLRSVELSTRSQRQWIRGQVQLIGRGDNDHGQVVVSIVGTPYTTRSSPEGLFELEVPPGTYTLRLAHPDYSEQRLPAVFVEQGNDVELGDIVLTPFSGSTTLALDVQPQWLPIEERYGYVTIDRVDGGYAAVRNLLVRHNEPITIEGLPAGRYRVSIQRPGFSTSASSDFVISTQERMAMVQADLSLVRLADTEISLEGRQLNACDLRRGRIDFRRSDLSGTTLSGDFGAVSAEDCTPQCDNPTCAMLDCDVDTCEALDLTRARLSNANFTSGMGSRLVGARLIAADLFGATLNGVDVSDAELSKANLFGVRAQGAIFSGADLSEANLSAADLRGAIFARVVGDERHVGVLSQDFNGDGVYHNEPHPWLGRRISATPFYLDPCTPMVSAVRYPVTDPSQHLARATNLNRTVLSQANLTGASLMGTDLSGAVLNGVRLVDADLRGVCLQDSILTLLDLTDALFDGADLQGARLSGAVLYRTRFRGANLQGVSLGSSAMDVSDFGPWVSTGVNDSCAQVSTSDFDLINCATDPNDLRCACITRLDGVDLSGSLIQGCRFVGASLTSGLFNSTTIAESTSAPAVQPDSCVPAAAETAYRFCMMSNQCDLFGVLSGRSEDPDRGEEDNWNCELFANGVSELLPGDNVGDAFRVEDFSCALSIYESEGQCLDGSIEAQIAEYASCFPLLLGEEVALPTFAERAPYESVCSFEAVSQTLSEGGCTMDDYEAGEPCCPRALIPYYCGVTESNFTRARLDRSIMRGVTLSVARFVNTPMRNVELENTVVLSSKFDGSILTGSDWSQSLIRDSSFVGIDASQLLLTGSEIYDSNFSQSNLWQTDFTESAIRRTSFDDTVMEPAADSESTSVGMYAFTLGAHEDALMVIRNPQWSGVNFSRVVFKNVCFEGGDLSRTRFEGSRLERVEFRSQYAEEALVPTQSDEPASVDFRPELDLTETRFFQSVLDGVSFDRVVLDGARFDQTEFDGFNQPGRTDPSRFERINIDAARPIIFSKTLLRRTLFDSVSMPNTVFGGATIEQSIFGGRGRAMLQGAQFGGSVIGSDGYLSTESLTISQSEFNDVDFRGADFSLAEFRSAGICKVRLFTQENDFRGAVFSTPDWVAQLSGVSWFKDGLEMSFRNVCACTDAVESFEFVGGGPLTEVSEYCEPYRLDCAPWPVCEVNLFD
jgi:uncharacterized protein YjbI with pentapeptide repeats